MPEKYTELKSGFEIVSDDIRGLMIFENTTNLILILRPNEAAELADALHKFYCPGGSNCPCVVSHIQDGKCHEVVSELVER